jgi:septal ring factor EnvC (AmiA/AmiB activator)
MGGVKKTIQDMVEKLVQEKEDEIKHRDFCIEEIGQNERDTTSKNRDKGDLEAKIDDLNTRIEELTRAIDDLKAAIADASLQLKHAGENREKANSEFQVVVADQRATQKLLSKALDILKGFYDKAALAQTGSKQSAGPPPPQGFKTYEKNEKSGGVMGMMQEIIDDAKKLEEEAVRDEERSQKDYEEFTVDTNESLDAMNLDLTNKSEARAKTESDKVEAETEHESVVGELEDLAASNSDLHKSCDYTLKNFDLRQQTRDDEVEALKQSIAIFSGASFGAFLQDDRNFQ